ncbi:MAG: PAS domain-containing protein, partial [Chloroflexi bacterium]|nr:PAS domain-containing protein [Chloroflexota bacterium]
MTPEEHFRLIADSLPMLLSYVDSEERFRFVNKKFEETFRRPIEEILGCELRDILGETAYEQIRPGIGLARAGQNVTQELVVDLPGAGPRNLNAT